MTILIKKFSSTSSLTFCTNQQHNLAGAFLGKIVLQTNFEKNIWTYNYIHTEDFTEYLSDTLRHEKWKYLLFS